MFQCLFPRDFSRGRNSTCFDWMGLYYRANHPELWNEQNRDQPVGFLSTPLASSQVHHVRREMVPFFWGKNIASPGSVCGASPTIMAVAPNTSWQNSTSRSGTWLEERNTFLMSLFSWKIVYVSNGGEA